MTTLAQRIRAEAEATTRPGQFTALMQIAREVAELERRIAIPDYEPNHEEVHRGN